MHNFLDVASVIHFNPGPHTGRVAGVAPSGRRRGTILRGAGTAETIGRHNIPNKINYEHSAEMVKKHAKVRQTPRSMQYPKPITTDPIVVLIAARALIAKPEAWCKGVSARSLDGGSVATLSTKAVAWCAIGALIRAAIGGPCEAPYRATYPSMACRMAEQALGSGFMRMNDASRTTHADVLRMFDTAIERLANDKAR